jgi:putative endonuclease
VHYVYVVACKDGSLYTGWTTDVEARIEAHNAGRGAKYTRGRGPVHLLHVESFENKGEALSREHAIKRLKRREKLALCEGKGADEKK